MPPVLFLDLVRVREILINLIGNAIKFTNQGFIRISLQTISLHDHLSKVDLRIHVIDSGIGIAKESHESIFHIFEQQENQDIRKYGGTGLGLSISRKLATLMNGSLKVESELGKGADFILTLHHVDIASIEDAQELNDDSSQLYFNKATLLVADDIEENRTLVKECFEGSEITILEAANGQEAVEIVHTCFVDLILMDIRMPILDGYRATTAIKASHDIPIIALTASIMKSDVDAIKQHRFDGYLRKPVSKKSLLNEVGRFLKHTSHKDETEEKPQEMTLLPLSREVKKALGTLHPLYLNATKSNDLSLIETFAAELLRIAQTHHLESLKEYAQNLKDQCEMFDIDEITIQLRIYEERWITHSKKTS